MRHTQMFTGFQHPILALADGAHSYRTRDSECWTLVSQRNARRLSQNQCDDICVGHYHDNNVIDMRRTWPLAWEAGVEQIPCVSELLIFTPRGPGARPRPVYHADALFGRHTVRAIVRK